jgi:hypothetical protein
MKRSLSISIFVVTLLVLTLVLPTAANAGGLTLSPASIAGQGIPGAGGQLPAYTIENKTGAPMHINLSVVSDQNAKELPAPQGWFTFEPAEFDLPAGTKQTFKVTMAIPKDAASGDYTCLLQAHATSGARSGLNIDFELNARIRLNVVSPDAFVPIARSELAALLVKKLGLEQPILTTALFLDVPPDHPNAAAIAAVNKAGLIAGIGGNRFDPNGQVTREQLAVILTRVALRLNPDSKFDQKVLAEISVSLADRAQISPWASDSVARALYMSWMRLNPQGGFSPASPVTRAEVELCLLKVR